MGSHIEPSVLSAHKTSHQNSGSDEINVAGLSGELADAQSPKAHDLGGAEHNADTLAALNLKISDATLDNSGNSRTPSTHQASHQSGGSDEIVGTLAAAAIPSLAASKVTSGQFPVDRMPRAASGFLEGKGAGVNPGYSALVEADIPAHMGKGKLGFTADKLLKGAGAGVDPTEIDVPTGGWTHDGTKIWDNTNAVVAYTDLDLSGYVGSNVALVVLKFKQRSGAAAGVFRIRTNGDTDVYFDDHTRFGGCSAGYALNNEFVLLVTETDSAGIIEWITNLANACDIWLIGYIK